MSDTSQELGNLSVRKRDWEELLKNPAWEQLVGVLQEQADALQQQILFKPLTDQMGLYERERLLGKLEGLLSVTATVESLQQELSLDILQAKQRKEQGDVVDEIL